MHVQNADVSMIHAGGNVREGDYDSWPLTAQAAKHMHATATSIQPRVSSLFYYSYYSATLDPFVHRLSAAIPDK